MNRRVSMAWSGVFLEPNWTAPSSGKPTSWTHWPRNSCPTGCTMWPTIWVCPDREPSPHSSKRATSLDRGWCTPETPTTTRWVGHVTSHVTHNMGVPGQGAPTTTRWVGHVTSHVTHNMGGPDREPLPLPGETKFSRYIEYYMVHVNVISVLGSPREWHQPERIRAKAEITFAM